MTDAVNGSYLELTPQIAHICLLSQCRHFPLEYVQVWHMQDSLLQDMRDAESGTSMPTVAHLNHSGMYWNVEPAAHSSISHTTDRLQPISSINT